MKKFFALALALILVLSLAACGGDKKAAGRSGAASTSLTTLS